MRKDHEHKILKWRSSNLGDNTVIKEHKRQTVINKSKVTGKSK